MKRSEMEGMSNLTKIREYCDYIEEHLVNVSKAWQIIQDRCKDMNIISDDFLFHIIDKMVAEHDLSKMSYEEFIPYQMNFFPVFIQDPTLMKDAWVHHVDNNPHHWENWIKITESFPNEQSCHCTCMVIDWIAMGMKFGDTAEQYYESNKDKIKIPQWAVNFIREIFSRIK